MAIVRAPRSDANFTTLSNDIIRDSRLSYRARGVLIAILSRPDDWRTDAEQLSHEAKEGRDAVRAALAELQAVGYIISRKFRTKSGVWASEMSVYDVPQDITAGQDQNGKPALVNQRGFPGPVLKTVNEELTHSSTPDVVDAIPGTLDPHSFDAFWEQYPRKEGKGAARKAWLKAIGKTKPPRIIEAARGYAERTTLEQQDRRFIKLPAGWLNDERWTDITNIPTRPHTDYDNIPTYVPGSYS